MKRYLCLYLPRWPLQRLYAATPDLRGKTVAIYERASHGLRLVVCSPEANKRGVKRGMLLADATALIPDLTLVESDPHADRTALEKLALWATRFSPLAGLETAAAPQTLLLDVTGCEQVFRGERNIVKLALQGLARKGYKARAAIAPTLGAAWALAHYGANGEIVPTTETQRHGEPETSNLKLETRSLRLCASVVETLAPLPLAALRLEGDAVTWLNQLGLCRIGDVVKQPRSALPSRFGEDLLERLDQAFGGAPELLPLLRPAPDFHATRTFEYGVKELPWLYPVLQDLVAQVTADMHRACRGARAIECWLYPEVSEPWCATVTLHKASASAKHLLQLLRTKLENSKLETRNSKFEGSDKQQTDSSLRGGLCHFGCSHEVARENSQGCNPWKWARDAEEALKGRASAASSLDTRHPSPATHHSSLIPHHSSLDSHDGICAVALRIVSSEPLDAEQMALFHQALRAPESLSMTLDRISTRLGRTGVLRARLRDDPQPEHAFRLEPWEPSSITPSPCGCRATAGLSGSAVSPSPCERGQGESDADDARSLPARLLTQPEAIAMEWPTRFYWHGAECKIANATGPERIETGWWKEAYCRRDYYVVAARSGARYWLFRRLDDGEWFVHGVFS
jgi:protein ImuB